MNTFSIKKISKQWYLCKFRMGSNVNWREFLDSFKACLSNPKGRYVPDGRAWLVQPTELDTVHQWVDAQPFDAVIWLHRNLEREFELQWQRDQLADRCRRLLEKVHQLRQPTRREFGTAPSIAQPGGSAPVNDDPDGIDALIRACQGLLDSDLQ